MRIDRRTDRQTDKLITILRTPPRGDVMIVLEIVRNGDRDLGSHNCVAY